MGIKQIARLDEVIKRRQDLKKRFAAKLEPYGILAQKTTKNVNHNVQSAVFYVPENIDRDELIGYLRSNDIETTIGTYCLSGCTYYLRKYNQLQPIADNLFKHTITLPCHDEVDADFVCNKIISFVEGK